MTKFYRILGFMIAVMLFMNACIKDTSPSRPAYIYIENIFFEADTMLGQGTSSAAITDAWPSVDGQQLGANNMPTLFPVILDENFPINTVKISAGIKDNGVTNTRAIYPFYKPYVVSLKLEPGKIDTFRPTLRYDTAATIIIVEDFENPNQAVFTTDLDGNPNTEMINQSTEVFEGAYSGLMVLDSANLDCTVATSSRYYNLQPPGTAFKVYFELNYKTNTPFQIGIIAHYANDSETIYKGGGNPSSTWKKIYFNITEDVFRANASEYSVVLRALKYPDTDQPLIYLDNIKILHF